MKKINFLFLILSISLFAQQDVVKVDLSSPYKAIFTHLHFLQSETYNESKAAEVIYGESPKNSIDIAVKIKQVLDGKGLKVIIKNLPTNPNYKDTLSVFEAKNRYVLFPEQLPEVYLEKIKGKWHYSEQTNREIAIIYKQVFPVGTEFVKRLIPEIGHHQFLGIQLWQYVGFVLLLFLGAVLFWLLNKIIFYGLKRLENVFVKTSHKSFNKILNKLARPLALLMVFVVVESYIAVLQFGIDVNSFLIKGLEIGQIVLWVYVFLEIIAVLIEVYISYTSKTENKLDDQLAPILSRLLKVIVVFVGILKMLTLFGVNPTTVLAGASIGGLAVALASQDTVKNLIGTFMIFLDKPFQIGDWIEGGGVVGTVEEVGFRSSRIRAVDTSVYTIPNSKLSEIVINNKGLRQYRRYQTKLGLRYDTPPELIEAFVLGVRKL